MGPTYERLNAGFAQTHWDEIYNRLTPEGVSWYESEPFLSLALVNNLELPRDTPIIDVGGGASSLVDGLLAASFTDVCVLDLSQAALDASRQRIGPNPHVRWTCTNILKWRPERRYGVWHDRAVFHFLTDARDRKAYMEILEESIAPGGHIVLFTFSPDGPEHCSGLPVAKYDTEGLSAALPSNFVVISSGQHDHMTPTAKTQPFTWLVAEAKNEATRPA